MHRFRWIWLAAAFVLAFGLPASWAVEPAQGAGTRPSLAPVVGQAQKFAVSPPLRNLTPPPPRSFTPEAESRPGPENPPLSKQKNLGASHVPAAPDAVVQSWPGLGSMPAPSTQWEGISNLNGVYPPDTEGDVGPNHYIQWVNLSLQIWDKNGTSLFGPVDGNTIWASLGGACATNNDGDPIVLYDALADRWLISQFVVPGPYYQAIAVSATSDPLGSWYLYCFQLSTTKMNDYPKFGVWPDGYYMTINQFVNASSWGGAGVVVFDREKMLAGDPSATFQYFDVGAVNLNYGGMLPSHMESTWNAPLAGTPNYIMEVDDGTWIPGYSNDALRIWECSVDWDTPANSTLGLASFEPNQILDVTPFTVLCPSTRDCIPQPGTSVGLDEIGDRLMYRLNYRNRGSYESAVVNMTVDAESGRAGVRWFELRRFGGAWSVHQEGTFAPADTEHRWMGSAAMDHMGNLAVGYSVSSGSVYPSIRYAGRLSGDPAGELTQGEASLMVGGPGVQTGGAFRWGDYSTLSIDPTDDCTFWYTQEYIGATTASAPWLTRIGAFKFPNCTTGPEGTLQGTVTSSASGLPVPIATVTATSASTTVQVSTNSNGAYSMTLPVGTYTVTVAGWGFVTQTANGVVVTESAVTVQDFSLSASQLYQVFGWVRDANTTWPLYASLSFSGYPYGAVWTDPVTGAYSIQLPAGASYDVTVSAWVTGYQTYLANTGTVTGDMGLSFGLTPNGTTCNAPGYSLSNGTVFFSEGFESATPPGLPSGWAQADVNGSSGNWATSATTVHPSGVAPHGGSRLAYFNSYTATSGNDTRLYRTSGVNLTGAPAAAVIFWMYHDTGYSGYMDRIQVQASTDGGSTWQSVGSAVPRYDGSTGWKQHVVVLSGITGGLTDVRIGLLGVSQYGNDIHVDDLQVTSGCGAPSVGGLVVGNVYDANTGTALTGATVQNLDRGSSATAASTSDPSEDDAFYCLYSDGNDAIQASFGSSYTAVSSNPSVGTGATVEQNFNLPAGQLSASPSPIDVSLSPGGSTTRTLTLSNSGGRTVNFSILESEQAPTSPASPVRPPYKLKQTSYWDPSETAPQDRLGELPNAWTSGTPIPTGARYRSAGTTPDGRYLYVFGGANASDAVLDESWRYDSYADSWHQLADMPVALMNMEATAIGTKIYLVGGYTGSAHTNHFLIYDIQGDSWTASTWPNARTPMTAAVGGQLYAFGGNPGPSAETWQYDPGTTSWTGPLTALPTATTYGSAVTVQNHVFVVGGSNGSGAVDDIQRYDPASNTWDASGPALPQGRMSPQAAWYGNGLYVSSGGGEGGGIWDPFSDTITLDTSAWPAGSWLSQGEAVPTPVVGAACDCVNNGLVTAGGSGATATVDSLQRLDDGVACSESPDVPWLSESPTSGTVAASGSSPVTVTLDASALGNGTYHGWLLISGDTPYPAITVPVNLTVGYGAVVATAGASPTNGSAPLAVSFTGSASGGDGGPYTYDWNFGDGTSHSNLQNPSHTYSTSGTFPVTLTVTDGHSNSGVDSHLSITVTSPPPTLIGVSPAKGSTLGGTAVTLTGTNFAAGSTVTFGGTAATGVTLVNSTTITCTAPAHAEGAVDVTLTVPGKPAVTLAGAFTYVTPASISSVSKKAPPFKLIILGSNFHNPCTVKVNGVTRGTVTWKSATKIVAKGTDLKTACPKGTTVQITVNNTDDGVDSAPYSYTR